MLAFLKRLFTRASPDPVVAPRPFYRHGRFFVERIGPWWAVCEEDGPGEVYIVEMCALRVSARGEVLRLYEQELAERRKAVAS